MIAWIGVIVGALAVLVTAGWWWVYAPQPREPVLAARVVHGEVVVDGRDRTYTAVVPDGLPPYAPVVLVFHGAGSDGATMRIFTGYRFDELAVERGFVAIYPPDGYQGTWNDCRLMSPYPAHTEDIDDEGFVAAIVAASATTLGTSTERVFAAGLSNGGHFALRLATGRPDLVLRVAAFAAAYPAPENNGCTFSGTPVATMFALGTADRINPFRGGMAGAFGRKLGTVLSARAARPSSPNATASPRRQSANRSRTQRRPESPTPRASPTRMTRPPSSSSKYAAAATWCRTRPIACLGSWAPPAGTWTAPLPPSTSFLAEPAWIWPLFDPLHTVVAVWRAVTVPHLRSAVIGAAAASSAVSGAICHSDSIVRSSE